MLHNSVFQSEASNAALKVRFAGLQATAQGGARHSIECN
ncbi:unnamed protein product [Mycetohabitans rhizoxinica HKI 454]|uniref:Uncharacterized protein n=1 Tax=Mycetohabitans rhizoxinica (strain DSM 19002 / CIP 109453 / HKI 454) TaxID=882378 RepID=E5AL66_MYCRK|nr:unnamed protein product [Mycetohabitans rhizoxinica HKI 454]